jgi:hypothetical protein
VVMDILQMHYIRFFIIIVVVIEITMNNIFIIDTYYQLDIDPLIFSP